MSQTFCPIPWNHVGIQTNGDFRVCCQVLDKPFGRLSKGGVQLNASTHESDEARNSDLVKKMRQQMLAGEKPSECRACWDAEELGLYSKRVEMNKAYPDLLELAKENTETDGSIDLERVPATYFDVRFGNRCNLRCRMCGPTDSSSWVDNHIEFHKPVWDKNNHPYHVNYYDQIEYPVKKVNKQWVVEGGGFKWYQGSPYWSELLSRLENVDRFYFTGGEPTLIDQHWELLEECIKKGVAKNITLEYTTNGTFLPSRAERVWAEFKRVEIGFSMDGIGPVGEYIRDQSRWDQVQKNLLRMEKMPESVVVGFETTISVLNIFHYPEIVQWLWDQDFKKVVLLPGFHTLEYPDYLNSQILPEKSKLEVEEKYKEFLYHVNNNDWPDYMKWAKDTVTSILNHMWADDKSHLIPRFINFTDRIDKMRNQNIAQSIPEIPRLLEFKRHRRVSMIKSALFMKDELRDFPL